MKRWIITTVLLGAVLAFSSAHAVFLDEARSIQVTGKVFTQASLRTEDSDSGGRKCYANLGASCEGFSFPDTKRGQLIQHRNLIDAEVYHDVATWLGPEFTALDQVAYRIRAKYFYDGVYDYGPKQYSEPFDSDADNDGNGAYPPGSVGLRNARYLNTQKDPLWNAYIELGKGPVFARIGRQDLSWGESDGFRLLDMIQPLDNRFGFPLVEDLDDRRIPLWMVRPTVSLPSFGPLSNLSIDGYWVPGSIDNQESPPAPDGNPFAAPNAPGRGEIRVPNKNLGNSRGGGRLLGTIGDAVNLSIGHYVTFNDIPSVRLRVDGINTIVPPGAGIAIFAPDGTFEVDYYQQQITGASATFALPFDPYTIVRMEAAHFWDERVFKPSESVDAAVGRCGVAAGPCPVPGRGDLPNKNTMRWMIGLDRNVWMRFLNPQQTFYLSAQYFHTNIFNYDRGIANAIVKSTSTGPIGEIPDVGPLLATSFEWVNRRNDEITITYLANTLYRNGTVQPQVFGLYDTRGVWGLVPSVSLQIGTNWVATVKYSIVMGNLTNLGLFRDRDMVLLRLQYNLS